MIINHALPCLRFFTFLLFVFLLNLPFVFGAEKHNPRPANLLPSQIKKEIKNGGLLLKDSDQVLYSHNQNRLFIPASIVKIITATAALQILGPDFRFKTEFYQLENGDLYIKGFGDPYLISEEIELIAKKLKSKLSKPLGSIYIDQSAFLLAGDNDWPGTSLNPYDAENFAMAVNFNTINFYATKSGVITSAEPQTPNLPVITSLKSTLGAGKHRVNISQNTQTVTRYVGELFLAKLKDNQEFSEHEIKEKPTPASALLILTHYSTRKLTDIIENMLQYSNNFIANQIFLTCGASQEGYPASWQKGVKTIDRFLTAEIGLTKTKEYKLVEGSGLSRKNMITAEAMWQILSKFKPYANLLPLKNDIRVKTGTLTGVYSLAGFLKKEQKEIPFVIILNQPQNNRERILNFLQTKIVK